MMNKTAVLLSMWIEARMRLSIQLDSISEDDLTKRIAENGSSVGFLLRHIGDVELLFAKNVFGNSHLKVRAQTIIDGKDSGNWTSVDELKNYLEEAAEALHLTIEGMSEDGWMETVTTNEFGSKTKAEAFARVISHTAYHAGQIRIINKWCKS